MRPVTILSEAEGELWEVVEYYEAMCPGLGLDFAAELESSFETISHYPEHRPLREDGTRRYLMHRFPYIVVYMYLNEKIWVVAIAHCRRRPGYWADRIGPSEKGHVGNQ